MQIPKKHLDEFKKIYKQDYGEDLSDDEAQEIAGRLIRIMKIIAQPLPGEKKK